MSPGAGLKHGDKFDGSGFYGWKFKTRLGLIQNKVWKCVAQNNEGQDENTMVQKAKQLKVDQEEEDLAYTFIMLSLSDNVQAVVRDCLTARQTWKRLEERYGGHEVQDRMELREKLREVKMKETDSINDHLARISDLVKQLKSAGGDLLEEELILTLLRSLPKKFESVKAFIRSRLSTSTLSFAEVQNSLLAEERSLRNEAELVESSADVYFANSKGRNVLPVERSDI